MDSHPEEEHDGRLGETSKERHYRRYGCANHKGGAYTIQRSEHMPEPNRLTEISGLRRFGHPSVPQWRRMRRLPGLLGAVVLFVGCVGGGTGPIAANPSTTTSTLPLTTTLPPVVTTTLAPGPPLALIAPSGVPVVVTGVDGTVFEVLTPCGNEAVLSDGTPIHEVDVVIDPGHGGPIDTGAVAPTGLAEKDINLAVSKAVEEILAERGIATLLTRTGDYPIPIRIRTEYSNLVGAKALVSIHHNAPVAPPADIPGVEIFVQDQTPESARLGGLIYDSTMAALAQFDVDWDRAPDAGVMTVLNDEGRDTYGMVRLPEAPSALVELGYIANAAEARLYAHPSYVPTAATAVADAIEAFLESEATGAPLVEGRQFTAQRGVGRDVCVEPDLEAPLYPDVIEASVTRDGTYEFVVTVSAPYSDTQRYSDAWRVVGDDGVVYAVFEHPEGSTPGTTTTNALGGVVIPSSVAKVTIEARDLVYGWGGGTRQVTLPGKRRPAFS